MTPGSETTGRAIEKAVWASPNESVEVDIHCAARSLAPVLITGPAHAAESVALEIHRRGSDGACPFTVVDCRYPDRLTSALRRRSENGGGTLMLRGVHRLTPSLQLQLSEALGRRKRRIVASSPIKLQRSEGKFDEKLFYRLNVIHIDLEQEH